MRSEWSRLCSSTAVVITVSEAMACLQLGLELGLGLKIEIYELLCLIKAYF